MVRYIQLPDQSSREVLPWYIFDGFYETFTETSGLYLALDLAGLSAVGPMNLSRSRLQLTDAGAKVTGKVLRIDPLPASARHDTAVMQTNAVIEGRQALP